MTVRYQHFNFLEGFFLILFIRTVGGYVSTSAIRSQPVVRDSLSLLAVKGYDSSSSLVDIKSDVERYILTRNNAINEEGKETSSTIESKDYEKFENPLEMFKPTGWFKDEVTLELATRSDRRIPKITHPLAFAELQRFGFENLSIPIMSLGGPHEVGIKLGLGWVEPIIEKTVYDEEKKILITTEYLMDTTGRLVLGGAQNDMMESSAAELDLGALKEAIKIKEQSMMSDNGMTGDLFKRDADGQINYKQSKNPLKKKSTYVIPVSKTPKSERFSLSGSQRSYFVLSSVSTALAHGRASQDLLTLGPKIFHIDPSLLSTGIEVANILSNILIIFAVVSCSYSYKMAGLKKRNPVVWSVKGLIGGPLSAIQLRDLDELI